MTRNWSWEVTQGAQGWPQGSLLCFYIQGLWSPQEFIATQGPLPQTMGDFWRLVWEQQSHCLVMLTNCVELGWVRGLELTLIQTLAQTLLAPSCRNPGSCIPVGL